MKDAKRLIPDAVEFAYDERDVIVYNMGVGATEKELQWVYEGDENFGALPTFGVCPQFASSAGFPFDWLPNFNPVGVSYFCESRVIHLVSRGSRRSFYTVNSIYRLRLPFLPAVCSLTKRGKRAMHSSYNTCINVITIHAPHRLYEVLDKGKAASVTAIVHTTDKRTGQVIFENQTTLVSRGSGGFGGRRIGRGQSGYG